MIHSIFLLSLVHCFESLTTYLCYSTGSWRTHGWRHYLFSKVCSWSFFVLLIQIQSLTCWFFLAAASSPRGRTLCEAHCWICSSQEGWQSKVQLFSGDHWPAATALKIYPLIAFTMSWYLSVVHTEGTIAVYTLYHFSWNVFSDCTITHEIRNGLTVHTVSNCSTLNYFQLFLFSFAC